MFVYAVYAFAFAWSEHSLNRKSSPPDRAPLFGLISSTVNSFGSVKRTNHACTSIMLTKTIKTTLGPAYNEFGYNEHPTIIEFFRK